MFTELNRIINLIYLIFKLCGYQWGEGEPSTSFLNKEKKSHYHQIAIVSNFLAQGLSIFMPFSSDCHSYLLNY